MKICIEGNVGGGKSTLLRKINEKTRLPIFLEPVDEWAQWLSLFYEDPKRWGLTFNLNVLMSFNNWKNVSCTALYERSPLACKSVFTALQFKNGYMTEAEHDLFLKIYEKLAWKQDIIIYLRSDPTICFERMQKRGRSCESAVSLDYLEKIHQYHELMMEEANKLGIQVFAVDANQDEDAVLRDVLNIINKLNPY